MVTFLLIALLAVLPIGLLVLFARDSDNFSPEAFIVLGFFVIVAFFFYKSMSADNTSDNEHESARYAQRYEYKKENNKKDYVHKSNRKIKKSADKRPKTNEKIYFFSGSEFYYIFTGLTAFLPAVVYLLYFVAFDDKKPEPFHVLLLAVLVGSVIAVAAWLMGFSLRNCGLAIKRHYDLAQSLYMGFVKIAIPSEIIKWIFLLLFLRLNKYYDEYIDGIVYSICLSMGFASIMYTGFMLHYVGYPTLTFFVLGTVTALILIPLYMMSGAIMGYFVALTKWRNKFLNYVLSLVVPVFVSGMLFSVMALIADNWWYYVFFIIILPIITCIVYRQISHLMELEREKSK